VTANVVPLRWRSEQRSLYPLIGLEVHFAEGKKREREGKGKERKKRVERDGRNPSFRNKILVTALS